MLHSNNTRVLSRMIATLRCSSSNLSNRSLFLITDNDDPLQGNKQQQSVALVFANDAHESGFQIKTFFMPADGSQFDLSLFWNVSS